MIYISINLHETGKSLSLEPFVHQIGHNFTFWNFWNLPVERCSSYIISLICSTSFSATDLVNGVNWFGKLAFHLSDYTPLIRCIMSLFVMNVSLVSFNLTDGIRKVKSCNTWNSDVVHFCFIRKRSHNYSNKLII